MEPNYYAIIPANVRYDKDLTANAKLLYGEITSLSNKHGYCWANNEYFAELYNVSKTSISKWISQLNEKEYVKVEIIYKEGTKQILNRYIRIVSYPIEEKLNTPIEEKLKDNNTSINNIINIKKEIIEKSELEKTFIDFLEMRKSIKKPATDRAIQLLKEKIKKLAQGSEKLAIDILNQSIVNSWQDVFPLKTDQYQKPSQTEAAPMRSKLLTP